MPRPPARIGQVEGAIPPPALKPVLDALQIGFEVAGESGERGSDVQSLIRIITSARQSQWP